jgi:hypothetical protein
VIGGEHCKDIIGSRFACITITIVIIITIMLMIMMRIIMVIIMTIKMMMSSIHHTMCCRDASSLLTYVIVSNELIVRSV